MTTPWKRIRSALLANAFGQVTTIVGQLLMVPLFLSQWGVGLYGEWLILSAIPAYFAFSDLGVPSAAGNQMAQQSAGGRQDEVLVTYHCLFVIVLLASLIGLLGGASVVALQSRFGFFRLSHIEEGRVALIVLLLVAYLAGGFLMSAGGSALRCGENYTFSAAFSNASRFVELLGTALLVFLNGDPLELAAMMLVMRCCATVIIFTQVRRRLPWLLPGVSQCRTDCLKGLVKPSLGFLAFPIGNALNAQGLLLIIGAVLDPTATVTYVTFRTVSNALLQVGTVVSFSTLPEISNAWGAGKLDLCQSILVKGVRYTLLATSVLALLIFSGGQWLIAFWTHGKVAYDAVFFGVILLSGVFNAFWVIANTSVIAINRHLGVALVYVLSSALIAVGVYATVGLFGLLGVGLNLVAANLVMCVSALWAAARAMDSRPGQLALRLVTG